jgi:hypothetical protein
VSGPDRRITVNPELLRYESDHVKDEHDKLRAHLGTMELAVELAATKFSLAVRGLHPDERWTLYEGLPGQPPAWDALVSAWVDYFIGQGSLVHHPSLVEFIESNVAEETVHNVTLHDDTLADATLFQVGA